MSARLTEPEMAEVEELLSRMSTEGLNALIAAMQSLQHAPRVRRTEVDRMDGVGLRP